MQTFLFIIATFSLAAFFAFSTATALFRPSRSQAMQPHLTNLWRMAIALLLAAIYLEISQ